MLLAKKITLPLSADGCRPINIYFCDIFGSEVGTKNSSEFRRYAASRPPHDNVLLDLQVQRI
jgi:hypothetical protein